MDEKQFWTRCFQSAFFYRDRQANQPTTKTIKDQIFDKLAAEEEKGKRFITDINT
jgi:hypothetical protein